MAKSASIVIAGAVSTCLAYHALAIYMATAAGVRPKIYEWTAGSDASPADQSSTITIARSSTGAPTGGTNPTAALLDLADGAALATTYAIATGGETMSTVLMNLSLNLRATFRWVAAPTKEFTIPNTQYAGCGIKVSAQSASYNLNLSLFWEE